MKRIALTLAMLVLSFSISGCSEVLQNFSNKDQGGFWGAAIGTGAGLALGLSPLQTVGAGVAGMAAGYLISDPDCHLRTQENGSYHGTQVSPNNGTKSKDCNKAVPMGSMPHFPPPPGW
ncbi:MAG TPA: hypothetical protein VFM02_00830 [Candidatus Paceibacterota bacterium]|nr:hypothetical protein [Candidatus Paceibacterota bacterium]